jgi:site-specific DNA recombinase
MKKEIKNTPFANQYLIYNRKSTDDADNQKNSLSYQLIRNLEFVKRNSLPVAEGLTILGFCDAGIVNESHSGFKEDLDFVITKNGSIQYSVLRPKFLRLVQMLKNKEIKGVIFLCWDRSSRNKQDDVILKKLISLGSDIRFSEATYDKTSSGELHMDIDGMFAAHYSRVISEKVKNAQHKLQLEGKCIYFTPIGYFDKGSGNKPLDPERAPIVKRIFELYSTGDWSFAQLGKWAAKQGLTTKPVRRKRTKEEISNNVSPDKIPKSTRTVDRKVIEHILHNPFYIGKVKTEYGYMASKVHQPLIDVALYNKVQNLLKERRVGVYYIDKPFYTYRKMIHCTCGRGYCPYLQKGIIYYLTKCKPGCENSNKNIRESDIDDAVLDLFSKMYFTDKELKEIEIKTKVELGVIAVNRNKELDDLHVQQKKWLADMDYLTTNKLTLLRTNTMDVDAIRAEENRISSKLSKIDVKIRAQAESAEAMLDYVISFSELVKNAYLYYKHALDTEKQELASNVFSELVIYGRKLQSYKAKEGFEALLNRPNMLVGTAGGGGGTRTHKPRKGQRLAISCNNHYTTPPVQILNFQFLDAEEVGLEPTNPVRGSCFQDRCNSRYATPPHLFYHKNYAKSI